MIKNRFTFLKLTNKQMLVLYLMAVYYVENKDNSKPFADMHQLLDRITVNLDNYGDKPLFMLEEMVKDEC